MIYLAMLSVGVLLVGVFAFFAAYWVAGWIIHVKSASDEEFDENMGQASFGLFRYLFKKYEWELNEGNIYSKKIDGQYKAEARVTSSSLAISFKGKRMYMETLIDYLQLLFFLKKVKDDLIAEGKEKRINWRKELLNF